MKGAALRCGAPLRPTAPEQLSPAGYLMWFNHVIGILNRRRGVRGGEVNPAPEGNEVCRRGKYGGDAAALQNETQVKGPGYGPPCRDVLYAIRIATPLHKRRDAGGGRLRWQLHRPRACDHIPYTESLGR